MKGDAAGVASDIRAQKIVQGDSGWSGDAADAYSAAAGRQADAASRVASISGTTANTTRDPRPQGRGKVIAVEAAVRRAADGRR